jgi:hypothetical protein
MPMLTRPTRSAVDRSRRSDARLAVSTVGTAVVGFVMLVLVPYAVTDFAPPAGLDVLWGVGGPLALVLAPIAAALAGTASWVALWRRGDLDDTTRRLHLMAIVTAATFGAFLVSHRGQAVLTWWQD